MKSDVTSEAVWRQPRPQRPHAWLMEAIMHMSTRVIRVAGFKCEAIFIALSLASLKGQCPLVFVQLRETMLAEHGCTVPWMPDPMICTPYILNETSIEGLLSTYDVLIKSGKILKMCQQPCNTMKFVFGWPDVSSQKVRGTFDTVQTVYNVFPIISGGRVSCIPPLRVSRNPYPRYYGKNVRVTSYRVNTVLG